MLSKLLNISQKPNQKSGHSLVSLLKLTIASLGVTGLVLLVRYFGGWQSAELMIFDLMVNLRPDPGPDPRLLVVEINEQDIANLQQWPISDRVLAKALAELQKHQPAAIALDLVRDIPNPPGYEELVQQFQQPNVIGSLVIGNNDRDRVSAPPSLPGTQIGFADMAIDPDGRVRRQLMFQPDGTALSVQVARIYLKNQQISDKLTENKEYQLGEKIFPRLSKSSGGYQTIDARGYQFLLTYRSKNVAQTISFTEVINGEIEPNLVKNKIVFIGVTAPSLKDLFFTPYSAGNYGQKMPGVEIHAQMTSQILSAVLDGEPLFGFWSEWAEVLWIFVWAIIGAILAGRIQQPLVLVGSAIASVGGIFGISYGLFLQAAWVPVAAPMATFFVTTILTELYQKQLVWQQEQMVMKLLGQQTSPEIASALWNSRDRLLQSGILPWQTLTATVLFTDIKNFSTISETKSPEELMTWLNPYLIAMSDRVLDYHGIVNKFTGDGIMAVFGVPVPRSSNEEIAQDAENAINCALAMAENLAELNQKWQQQKLPKVQMRVGIFTGLITVGSLGGKNRLEYGVIGDTVNTASRLESCEKQRQPDDCRILIGQATLEYVQGKFEVESWGPLPLKGKQQMVEVYRAIGRVV